MVHEVARRPGLANTWSGAPAWWQFHTSGLDSEFRCKIITDNLVDDLTRSLRPDNEARYAPFGLLYCVDRLERSPRPVWEFQLDFPTAIQVLGREPEVQDPCLASWGKLSLEQAGRLLELEDEKLEDLRSCIGEGLAPESYFLSLVYQSLKGQRGE